MPAQYDDANEELDEAVSELLDEDDLFLTPEFITEVFYRLEEGASIGLTISEEDLEYMFLMLHHPNLEVSARAAVFLTGLREKSVVMRLIMAFDALPPVTQEKLIMLMIVSENVEVYVHLLSFLKKCTDPLLSLVTEISLAKTDYPILPLLLQEIATANEEYLAKLAVIVKYMDRVILTSHLRLFPIFPQEKFFRKVLGNDFVESVYRKQYNN